MQNKNPGSNQSHPQMNPVTGQICKLKIENPKNNDGKTPLDMATHPKIWEYINSHLEEENSAKRQK